MKPTVVLLLVSMFFTGVGTAQTRTTETKTSVEKKEGDTTTTQSVIISQSEDITPLTSMIIVNPLKFILFYNLSYFHRLSSSTVIGGGIQFRPLQTCPASVEMPRCGLPVKEGPPRVLRRAEHLVQ